MYLGIYSYIENLKLDDTATFDLKDMDGFLVKLDTLSGNIFSSLIAFETHALNRNAALEYVKATHVSSELLPEEHVEVEFLLKRLPSMLHSVRAAEVQSASSLSRLIFFKYVNCGYRVNLPTTTDISINLSPAETYIRMFCDMLNANIAVARNNLARSSSQFPLNGILASLGQVLQSMDLKREWEADNYSLTDLLLHFSKQCQECCQIVLDICTHSSP
jgi:hypothetical protein